MLEQAVAANSPGVYGIKSDSYFIPLQAEARYQALLRKLNLPD